MRRMHRTGRLAAGLAVLLLAGPFPVPVRGADDGPRPGLYDSVWPHGRSDAWRTGAARAAGLPADIESRGLTTMSVELPTAPTWGTVYSDDAIFVQGGTPFLIEGFTTATAAEAGTGGPTALQKLKMLAGGLMAAAVRPYVAKIDPRTMTVVDTVYFPRGSTVNYVSCLLIHENGKIYTIDSAVLYEIDPATMATRSLKLPLFETSWRGTVYNTLQVSPRTGDIIVKATNLLDRSLPSRLVAVNTSDLSIRFQFEFPIGAARIALAVQGDTEYIYAANDTNTLRFAIGETGFEPDDAWSKVYRTEGDGSTSAVGMVYMGDRNKVVFPNNNTVIFGVTKPLKLFMQSTDTTENTLYSVNATSAKGPGGSFFAAAADPFNSSILVENDQINGIMAGWRVTEGGTLEKIWETADYKSTGGTAIGSDQGHFYLDDRRCDEQEANCELYLVVLDLATGKKLSEVKVAGSRSTIGQIFLGGDDVFFIATEPGEHKGYVTKVSAR